ncbi:12741_t:CDS:2, partial [Gigaspora margarita]
MYFALQIIDQGIKEKLYTALRSKAEINDLREKLLTKYLEQEKELQQLRWLKKRKNVCLACGQAGLDYNVKEAGNSKKKKVDEPRSYSRVRLCEEADSIYYFKPAPAF